MKLFVEVNDGTWPVAGDPSFAKPDATIVEFKVKDVVESAPEELIAVNA